MVVLVGRCPRCQKSAGIQLWINGEGFIKMKIATFNIWNSDRGMPLREQQIINEIKSVNSDVICLQEVKEEVYNKLNSELTEYQHSYYHYFNAEYTGLAVFSKYPILKKHYTECAIFTTCEYENNVYLVINVHLPWDSVSQKEQLIVNILQESRSIDADYAILTGDFNCSVNSSVHQYITGQRTLLNTEVTSFWDDLAEVYAEITNTEPEFTLNLRTNPRWKGKDFAVTSGRLDRIYLRDAFPKAFPELKSFALFGKEVDEESGYCASDHYGVVAEISVD